MRLTPTLSCIIVLMSLGLIEMEMRRTLNLEGLRNCKTIRSQDPEDEMTAMGQLTSGKLVRSKIKLHSGNLVPPVGTCMSQL